MKYLIDTHVLIYLGTGRTDSISKTALDVYKNPDTEIYVSQVSFWEIAIKINIGKLYIPVGLQNVIILTRQVGIRTISIQNSHILNYTKLPILADHKDPFDRLIVSIAQLEKIPIITSDRNFDLYNNIQRLW